MTMSRCASQSRSHLVEGMDIMDCTLMKRSTKDRPHAAQHSTTILFVLQTHAKVAPPRLSVLVLKFGV